MKKIILLIAITGTIFAAGIDNENEKNEKDRLCKVFTEKFNTYEKNNRGDELAIKTLESYKKRQDLYCN